MSRSVDLSILSVMTYRGGEGSSLAMSCILYATCYYKLLLRLPKAANIAKSIKVIYSST